MAPFSSPEPDRHGGWNARLLLFAAVLAALYVGREVFAPLALALLLTIASLPVVEWLERRRVPRVPAVLVVLLIVVGIFAGLVYVVLTQALTLAAELPRYETVLRTKIEGLSPGSGPIDGVTRLVQRLSDVMSPAEASTTMTVAVAASERGPVSTLFGVILLIVAPVATLAITLLLMAFILVQREDVRDRVLRLAGLHELHRTTGAMAEATTRVGKFLLMQVAMNAIFGASMGIGLWLLGVPQAPLWGALGFALRFIPFLGAPLSVLFPLIVAFATTEGWGTVIAVIALFAVVDILITYVMEPWVYGASMGITPLALLLSAAFWALIWGPIGLILAPAITACLVILGRHIRVLAFLDVLLGDTEPLPVHARFYQRVLAEDVRGARELLAGEAVRLDVPAAIEQLVLPAIAQIERDRPDEAFGAALAIRASRALARVLEGLEEEAEGRADILVLPIAGALDHAAAAAIHAALLEAGHASTLSRIRAIEPALVLIVAATAPPVHRLNRALREGRALGGRILGFAATEGAAAALDATLQQPAWETELPSLLTMVEEIFRTQAQEAA